MSRILGKNEAPPATRATHPGWRDPRLWVGVAIVAASVLTGARVLAGADDAVSVWAAAEDLASGDTLEPEDLVVRRVRFVDADTPERYLRADRGLPEARELLTGLNQGELLPRSALGQTGASDLVQVPIWSAGEAVPPSVRSGSVVQIWSAADGDRAAELIVDRAVVIEAPAVADAFGPASTRQLVVGVATGDQAELARLITATTSTGVHVVRQE